MKTLNYDIAIIGGGASGLMAALSAARTLQEHNCAAKIAILEKEPRVGKKILATGNGKCNLTNIHTSIKNYYSETPNIVSSVLDIASHDFIMQLFSELGLIVTTDNQGRVYPYSSQASAVLDLLRLHINALNVEELCNFNISKIEKIKSGFKITSDSLIIIAKELICATGGQASPALGSDGSGYKYMQNLGHTIIKPFPSLVQIKTDNKFINSLKGIRTHGCVKLVSGNRVLKEEYGEIQFSENALSGICIFQISRFISEYYTKGTINGKKVKDVTISIDLLPNYSIEEVKDILVKHAKLFSHLSVDDFMIGILNKRIGQVLLKTCSITPMSRDVNSLSKNELFRLAECIKRWDIHPTGTMPWKNAQVTAGGINANEFNPQTLESKKITDLFACGEILDVDGECGGFNLQWAWSSGYIAGVSASLKLINDMRKEKKC